MNTGSRNTHILRRKHRTSIAFMWREIRFRMSTYMYLHQIIRDHPLFSEVHCSQRSLQDISRFNNFIYLDRIPTLVRAVLILIHFECFMWKCTQFGRKVGGFLSSTEWYTLQNEAIYQVIYTGINDFLESVLKVDESTWKFKIILLLTSYVWLV